MTQQPLLLAIAAIAGYLLGSLSFSILLSQSHYKDDIRNHGSGNAGMTNMLRTFGKWAAVLVFAGDFFKGTGAVLIGRALAGETGGLLAALCAVVGHLFPLYFGFRGGKGVSTAAGCILGLYPPVLLVLLPLFLAIVFVSRYVSLGSLVVAAAYPVTVWLMGCSVPQIVTAVVIGGLVIWRHRANIGRLRSGTESKIGQKKT